MTKPKLIPVTRTTILICLTVVLLAELGLRFIYTGVEVNGSYWGKGSFKTSISLGYVHAPNFEGLAMRRGSFVSKVNTNQLGLRQSNLTQQLQYQKRILFLGDSFTFGLGVEERETYVSLLEESMNAIGVGIVNGGQTGYSVIQETLFGKQLIDKINPSLVILSPYLPDDVHRDMRATYQNIEVVYGYRMKKDRYLRGGITDYIRAHSFLWMRTAKLLRPKPTQQHRSIEWQHSPNPSEAATIELKHYLSLRNIDFGVVLLDHQENSPLSRSFVKTVKSQGYPHLLIDSSYFTKKYRFKIDNHLNKNGHQNIAAAIRPFLLSLVSATARRD